MKQKNEVEVIIAGEVYKLVSEESPEHIQKVARRINKKIDEIYEKGAAPTINSYISSLYITINIADECIKAEEIAENIQAEKDSYLERMNSVESENHLLKQKVKLLEEELFDVRNELKDYINTFDKTGKEPNELKEVKNDSKKRRRK